MSRRTPRVGPFLFASTIAVVLAGCGDDTVNPSNPDAAPSKAPTATDGGHDAAGQEAATEEAAAVAADEGPDDAAPAADDQTPEGGDDGGP